MTGRTPPPRHEGTPGPASRREEQTQKWARKADEISATATSNSSSVRPGKGPSSSAHPGGRAQAPQSASEPVAPNRQAAIDKEKTEPCVQRNSPGSEHPAGMHDGCEAAHEQQVLDKLMSGLKRRFEGRDNLTVSAFRKEVGPLAKGMTDEALENMMWYATQKVDGCTCSVTSESWCDACEAHYSRSQGPSEQGMSAEMVESINLAIDALKSRFTGRQFQLNEFRTAMRWHIGPSIDSCPDHIIANMSWQCVCPDCTCGPWPIQSVCPQCQCRLEAMGFGSSGKGDGKTARMLKADRRRANAAQRR